MKSERLKIKVIQSHKVSTSESGEPGTWYRFHGKTHDGTPAGRKSAETEAREVSKSHRFVRVAFVEEKIKPLKVLENLNILSKQQIADLLAKGNAALEGIPGMMVNEGFMIGFDDNGIVHSPTRVSTSFNAGSILGKRPVFGKDQIEERKKWDTEAKELLATTLDQCVERLTAAGIKHRRGSYDITLMP